MARVTAHPRTTRSALLGVLVGLLCLLAAVVAVPAHAATRTVTLAANGPIPARLVLDPGDRVQFVNGDNVQHRVTSGKGWTFDSGVLSPGDRSKLTPALPAGTYAYTDTRSLVVSLQTFPGSLVVKAGAPSPTPSRSPAPAPPPRPSTAPTPAVVPTPPPGGTAVPSAFPTAVVLPTASAPAPAELPTVVAPSAAPTATPSPILYGDATALVQHSPHRYGLPVVLGMVAIAGVASLLVRLLLSMAPATRRTEDEPDA